MHCMACFAALTFLAFTWISFLTLRLVFNIAICVYIRHINYLDARFSYHLHVSIVNMQRKKPLIVTLVCVWNFLLLITCFSLAFYVLLGTFNVFTNALIVHTTYCCLI